MTTRKDDHKFSNAKLGAAFAVRLVTRAQRDEVVGVQEDGTLKIRLTAPPTDGQANAALIAFLASRLGVPEKAVEIIAGHDHRDKMISIEGVTTADIDERLRPDPGVSDSD
ncbi:MAG TPA: DUF167 domain-containing protein [Aggregatilineales bacterium]|nr:DUF167 domain-containing protein [Anaerolineales bacterium]HRE47913.1 DUF167 domain-containing protein [Aggregatilineales bacterium]